MIMKLAPFTASGLLLCAAFAATAQQPATKPQGNQTTAKPVAKSATPAIADPAKSSIAAPPAFSSATAPVELARISLQAHGGERFRTLKNMVLRGAVDLYSPNSTQALGGQFAVVMAGEQFRMDIQSPAFTMRSIFDGEQSYSSMPQFQLPAINRYGYNLLFNFEKPGYLVSALSDKKKTGFRVASPDGAVTDFYLDPKTGRIQRFVIPTSDGISFSIEHKTFKEIDGVLVPMSFIQKFETPQGVFYAESKVKTALLNQKLDADVFAIPAQ
jgi:sporulation protein YlmC with PRC-barrel domain